MGSPPQILTHGAPHSSTAARHSSTVSLSLIVLTYSRMRPQPVQVRLHACNGSSISTSGNFFSPESFFLSKYVVMVRVKENGNRIGCSPVKVVDQGSRNRRCRRWSQIRKRNANSDLCSCSAHMTRISLSLSATICVICGSFRLFVLRRHHRVGPGCQGQERKVDRIQVIAQVK